MEFEGPEHRKRMTRHEIRGGARFVTFSCQHRMPLMGHPLIRDAFAAALVQMRARFPVQLFAWVVMPEHVHLMVRPRDEVPLAVPLKSLKQAVAQRVILRWKKVAPDMLARIADPEGRPRFWLKGGGFDRNVRTIAEFCREVRYIHLNPVERGLVKEPADWKWSSVRWWMGQREGEVECDPVPDVLPTWKGYV